MWAPCAGCSCPNHTVPILPKSAVDSWPDRVVADDTMERLLLTNDCPMAMEVNAIVGVLSEAQSNLLQLQRRVDLLNDVFVKTVVHLARMNSIAVALHEEQERIRIFVKERETLLSPVRRLPTEVLHEIFIQTVESLSYEWEVNDAGVNICNTTRPKSSLWNILRVSKSWRAALLSCSAAWSFITILDADQFNAKDYNDSRRIARHLEYSRQFPLSVVIFFDPPPGKSQEFPEKLLSSLLHYSNRIKYLHLCIPASAFPQLHPLKYSWNSLRNLSIMPTSFSGLEDVGAENLPVVDVFADAPLLGDVRLMQVLSESQFELPWHQIKHHRNTTWVIPRVEVILDLFEHATSLETLNFDSDLEMPLEKLTFVTPPALQTFVYVMDGTYCALSMLFDHLVVPTLTHLEISTSHEDPDPEHLVMPALIRLIERSACALRILALSRVPVSPKQLEQVASMAPTVEELWLTSVGSDALTNDMLLKMTAGQDDLVFPRLRELDLEGQWDFDVTIFVDMVKSRWRQPLPWRLWSLGVDWWEPAHMRVLLEECADQGMSVTVEEWIVPGEDDADADEDEEDDADSSSE